MYTDPITQRIIETKIAQIKGAHPESKVVKQGEGHFADPVVVFVREQRYSGQFDRARFFVELVGSSFLQADIYHGEDYQFSIETCSGPWQERLGELEVAVGKVAEEGLEAIREQVESEDFGIKRAPIE